MKKLNLKFYKLIYIAIITVLLIFLFSCSSKLNSDNSFLDESTKLDEENTYTLYGGLISVAVGNKSKIASELNFDYETKEEKWYNPLDTVNDANNNNDIKINTSTNSEIQKTKKVLNEPIDSFRVIENNTFVVEDFNLLNGATIYLIKHQSIAQILSVAVRTSDGKLVIFDGGRIADAEFLSKFIESEGNGKVDAWFITHIHDDHLGALYEILDKYAEKIYIENIYYKFANQDFYVKHIGEDAGIVQLFNEKLIEYIEYKNFETMTEDYQRYEVKIHYDIKKNDIINIDSEDSVSIKVMNNPYMLNHDPINNSSIVYKISINGIDMMVLGDLAYYGGEELLKEYTENNELDKLKSDIVVMAHHGQSGVDYSVYNAISPEIALWPTTKEIYENADGKYRTNETKSFVSKLGILYNYATTNYSYIIK